MTSERLDLILVGGSPCALLRAQIAYAERTGCPWAIVSAQGLVAPTRVTHGLRPRDLGAQHQALWAERLVTEVGGGVVELLAGASYTGTLLPRLLAQRCHLLQPLHGLGSEHRRLERLQQMRRWALLLLRVRAAAAVRGIDGSYVDSYLQRHKASLAAQLRQPPLRLIPAHRCARCGKPFAATWWTTSEPRRYCSGSCRGRASEARARISGLTPPPPASFADGRSG